ncbi:4Fe-4S dicluster domain-containing protein [Candidatus Marinarcus aquaticus]|uniref:4Fe-4S ferredoxin n=1 Tax=Candidatus Marinarcus aquaticus TaxID=2044504 RepID=A0A4Q0XTS6_9BACT|nr:4Fe-4S dicluster domain-containing protein [Candidatus Marinarcus aquaticus]RXJ60782.1 4Fe-4S ferredoxin [Candidatus Marinarcus aquaticus]
MQEFIYYNPNSLEFPLNEEVLISSTLKELKEINCIVSNSDQVNAQVVAKEIDFYIQNSQDNLSNKMKNVGKLYKINALRFDLSLDMEQELQVDNRVLLIGTQEQKDDFLGSKLALEFEFYHIDASILKMIDGHMGSFEVIVDNDGKETVLKVSQIVWFDATETFDRAGIYDPISSSHDDVFEQLLQNTKGHIYKKFITYDSSICQYHDRRDEVCAQCVNVCPTVAITKDDENKHLIFSDIDCLGCGGCISVCPSGALDYAPMNTESFFQISRMYEGHTPLIIPAKMNIHEINIELKEHVLPLSIEGEKFLDESKLLTLLQESGSQIVFYTDFLSKGTTDAIDILNQIYKKKYNCKAILVAQNEQELQAALQEVQFVENSRYSINQTTEKKRENFAIRLEKIVDGQDLGRVITGPSVHYAKVNVNEANCTLCLSCVGACNVDALIADATDNTLQLNSSLCTACGYCELSCPEKDCLSIEQDMIELQPSWFTYNVLAQDELFACVECGKEFATKKAVEKIAHMMSPIFSKMSKTKERTLYCCEDCKAKLMIQEGLLHA